MSKGTENMDIVSDRSEDAETEYFQDIRGLDDSVDQSIDSAQGSLSLPTFTMNQSSGLHGSHGFQVFQGSNLNSSGKSASSISNQIPGAGQLVGSGGHHPSAFTMGTGQFMPSFEHVTAGTTLPGNTLIFSNSQLSALNVLTSAADQFQIVLPADVSDTGQYSKIAVKTESVDSGTVSTASTASTSGTENVEGGSSDEKSGKTKASPKRRGRKSRSTSSAGNEMSVKTESVTGPSPCKMEVSEPQQSNSDVGIKPSLLDEILTEKKMGLLRSPEVLKILQTQQQLIEREKKITHSTTIDS